MALLHTTVKLSSSSKLVPMWSLETKSSKVLIAESSFIASTIVFSSFKAIAYDLEASALILIIFALISETISLYTIELLGAIYNESRDAYILQLI